MACEEITSQSGVKSYIGKVSLYGEDATVAFLPTNNATYPVLGIELRETAVVSEADFRKMLQSIKFQ